MQAHLLPEPVKGPLQIAGHRRCLEKLKLAFPFRGRWAHGDRVRTAISCVLWWWEGEAYIGHTYHRY